MNAYALEETNMELVTCFSCGQSGETSTSAQSLLLLDVTVMTLEMSGRGHSEIPNENQRIMKRTHWSIIPWISMSFCRIRLHVQFRGMFIKLIAVSVKFSINSDCC